MRITKVKDDTDKVVIQYEHEAPNGRRDKHTLECAEAPTPELRDALQALAPHVVDICELPEEYANRLSIRGVAFSYGGELETMGATITALAKLATSNAPLVLNTPHKPSDSYAEGGDTTMCLSSDCITALTVLQEQAIGYVNGNRTQLEFDMSGGAETKKAA